MACSHWSSDFWIEPKSIFYPAAFFESGGVLTKTSEFGKINTGFSKKG